MWWRRFTHVCYEERVRAGRAPSSVSGPPPTWGEVMAQDSTGPGERSCAAAACATKKAKMVIPIYVKVAKACKMASDRVATAAPKASWAAVAMPGVGRARPGAHSPWLTRDRHGGRGSPGSSRPGLPPPASSEKLPSSQLNLTWRQFNFLIFARAGGLQKAWSPPAPSVGCPVSAFHFLVGRKSALDE